MRYCGIILAKQHSERLPDKNFLKILNLPVFKYAVQAINGMDVYTFSERYGNRPEQASLDNEPLWSALKWAYKSLPKRYDAIINIMANAPLFTTVDVLKAIERFEALGCDELRSFNKDGTESGLMIVKEKYLLEKHEVSTYQAAIELESIEIHTQKDFELCKQKLSQK